MKLEEIAGLGRKLADFLERFSGCFKRKKCQNLMQAYVSGQLSSCQRKSIEPMALAVGVAPRTLQRFVESLPWDEEKLRDRCQVIVAQEHSHPQAIGLIDESGTAKSGNETAGAARQWCGRTGKVDNCTVAVHTCYATPDFHCLLDSDQYLPQAWTQDRERREKAHIPEDVARRLGRQSPGIPGLRGSFAEHAAPRRRRTARPCPHRLRAARTWQRRTPSENRNIETVETGHGHATEPAQRSASGLGFALDFHVNGWVPKDKIACVWQGG